MINANNFLEDYYEITNNYLYPGELKVKDAKTMKGWKKDSTYEIRGSKLTNTNDKQKQKMTTKPTRLVMPSQEYVGETRLVQKALVNAIDRCYPSMNLLNRNVKKVRFGQGSM